MNFRLLTLSMVALIGLAGIARADCTGPAAPAGRVVYAANQGVMAFCDGTNWVSMAGGVSVTVGGTTGATTLDELTDATITTPASGQYLTYNGSAWVNNASPLGTITDTKWCVGNSSGQVVCNTDAPILTEADPEVGALTASNFCQVNAGGTAIVCGNDAATQRTALGLGTLATASSVSWNLLTDVPASVAYVSTTLDTTELGYINGLNQALATTSAPTFAGVTAANVTATTALSAAALCDENGANCVEVTDIGTSNAQGDRIISGTHTVVANELSGYVSLSTGGTTWGYLGSAASYLPQLLAAHVSTSSLTVNGVAITGGASSQWTTTGSDIYYNTGNVGIGTTGPIAPFQLSSARSGALSLSANTNTLWQVGSNSQGVALALGFDTASPYGAILQTKRESSDGSSWPLVLNPLGGNVGIGTTGPQKPLHVNTATTAGQLTALRLSHAGSSTNDDVALEFFPADGVLSEGAKIVATAPGSGNVPLAFYTSNGGAAAAERMRIDYNGNVGIGTTVPDNKLSVEGAPLTGSAFTGTTPGILAVVGDAYTSGDIVPLDFKSNNQGADAMGRIGMLMTGSGSNMVFGTSNDYSAGITNSAMTIDYSGNVGIGTTGPSYKLHVVGQVAGNAAYVNTSDMRLKKDIAPIAYGLGTVMQLRPVSFNWKEQKEAWQKQHQIGLIAQEVEQVVPEVVSIADDPSQTRSLAYGALVPVLIKSVQELKAANDELRAEFETYKRAHP